MAALTFAAPAKCWPEGATAPPDDLDSDTAVVGWAGCLVEVEWERDEFGAVVVLCMTHAGLTLEADDLSHSTLTQLAAAVRAQVERDT